jgi:NAD(P)-dependent dehydrogenase (short-subunit alcohol dehydrogenase family)
MHRLQGKVAIVTGGGSGIGQAIAKRLGCEGAKVIIDYVGSEAGADDTRRAIDECGSQGEVTQADVTKMDDVRHLVDAAWDRFGSADILVNNAGMEKRSDFWDTPEDDYDNSWPSIFVDLSSSPRPSSAACATPKSQAASSTSVPSTKTWPSPASPPTAAAKAACA